MELKRGYKQTDVGVIPEDWDVKCVGDSFDVCNQLRLPISQSVRERMNGSYPYYGPTSVQGWINEYRIEGEYALIGEDGDHFLKWKSQPMTLLVRGKFNVNNHAHVVQGTKNLTEWFYRFFSNRDLTPYLTRQGAGRYKLTKAALLQIPCVLPSPREQRAIAEALNDVDALLGGLDRLIAKKRDLKQAAMQQLLTGQTRLPGFHGEWEEMQVQDVIAGFFCGPSPTCEERNIQDEFEWGVLKTTAATKENGWDWTKHKTLPRVFWNKPHIELRKGDVIVTKAGPRHRVGVTAWVNYVPLRIIPSGKMIALRFHPDKVVPLMLAAAISARGTQTYLDQRTTGMAESQVNFENSALLKAPIRTPPIEEQTAIAAVLTDMDAELAALEQRRAKTRALKQGMMQELLTGRIRLIN